jgi:glycosyltransferase involved in cell wall biosynthesis
MQQPQRGGRPMIGMALYGDLTYDSRVRREAATLAGAGYDVTIACLWGDADGAADDLPDNVRVLVMRPEISAVLPESANPFFDLAAGRLSALVRRVGWLRDYVRNLRAWGRLVLAACGPVDIWHLHDLTGLVAIAPRLASGAAYVYDAHELFLETGTSRRLPAPVRALLRAYEGRLVRRARAVLTVNDALAEVLQRRYRPRRITVLHNCPDRWTPPAERPRLLREAAGVPADGPVILYHGGMYIQRGVEQLMAALQEPGLERAHLVLMGMGGQRQTYAAAAREPARGGRVHVLDPVLPADLLAWVASADVGVMPIQATTLNHLLSTPNKLFECLAAGTPVVASDFPTMRQIVMDDPAGPLGAVCDPASPASVGAALRSIIELDRPAAEALRTRCLLAARERWNWGVVSMALTGLYADLFGEGSLRGADQRR